MAIALKQNGLWARLQRLTGGVVHALQDPVDKRGLRRQIARLNMESQAKKDKSDAGAGPREGVAKYHNG